MNKQELVDKYGEGIGVLDKGLVRFIDCLGDDNAITQMARVSYGEGTTSVSSDKTLIRYLMRHHHSSPFEGCVIKLHMKMPLLVARQFVRHRTQSLNEVSARYSQLPDEFYVPDINNIRIQASNNKQGSEGALPEPQALQAISDISEFCDQAYALYESLLEQGVAREIARSVLPVNIYTEWYTVMNLHNLFHFLKLRMDSHAQYEAQVFANAIYEIVKDWVPIAAEAFRDYRLEGISLSRAELACLKDMLSGNLGVETVWADEIPISPYRWTQVAEETDYGRGVEEAVLCRPSTLQDLDNVQRKVYLESQGLSNKREQQEFLAKLEIIEFLAKLESTC
jgi:thymidylate synthase (FAD)